ncbi:MAG: hypothetical protein ACLRXQ_01660 [Phascolarctobacterium faecium]
MPWGQGSGKFFYLPEAHTDLHLHLCQEWDCWCGDPDFGVLLLAAAFSVLP